MGLEEVGGTEEETEDVVESPSRRFLNEVHGSARTVLFLS
jgi:hypothetical protein